MSTVSDPAGLPPRPAEGTTAASIPSHNQIDHKDLLLTAGPWNVSASRKIAPINLIPDSGCQHIQLPIASKMPKGTKEVEPDNSLYPELWESKAYRDCTDESGKPCAWAKYRIIKNESKKDELLLDLLVDTTLGTCERGLAIGNVPPDENYQPGANHFEEGSNSPGHYVAQDNKASLRQPGWKEDDPLITSLRCALDTGIDEKLVGAHLVSLKLHWEDDDNPLAVDIAVDFGNTRSCIVAMEDQAGKSINHALRPLLFLDEHELYQGNAAPEKKAADSYLVLRESRRANLTPELHLCEYKTEVEKKWFKDVATKKLQKVTKMATHQFAFLSPALLGEPAKEKTRQLEPDHGNARLSSPKRYIADTDPISNESRSRWTMIHRDSTEGNKKHQALQGRILRFLSEADRPWVIEAPHSNEDKKANPSYPRAQAMTWAALAILESADLQINSKDWRESHQRTQRRYIRNIAVTFPAGWTREEVEHYKRRWREAVDIYALTRFANPRKDPKTDPKGYGRPHLLMGDAFSPDEAVAAQLPFVYAEMLRLNNRGENWLELYGRPLEKGSKHHAARVMSIDIGGGTTDLAVIEYTDEIPGAGIALASRQLFRDSVAVAGDAVMQKILCEVVLPSIAGDSEENFDKLKKFMSETKGQAKDGRGHFATLIWDPLVRYLLAQKEEVIRADGVIKFKSLREGPEDTNAGKCATNADTIAELGKALTGAGIESDLTNSEFRIEMSELRRCWRETFEPLAKSWAAYASALEVDLVVVSGKPSEQAVLRELLHLKLPISASRILFARDFEAGEWWPMGDHKVEDAKHVTAVGLALYGAIQRGQIPGWSLKIHPLGRNAWWSRNHWGKMTTASKEHRLQTDDYVLTPDQDENTCKMTVGTRIARQLLKEGGHADFVYELRWKDPARRTGIAGQEAAAKMLQVTLRCEVDDSGERLRLISAVGEDDKDIASELELRINTLADKDHWRDSGIFHIEKPKNKAAR